jgi:hypothetical protein
MAYIVKAGLLTCTGPNDSKVYLEKGDPIPEEITEDELQAFLRIDAIADEADVAKAAAAAAELAREQAAALYALGVTPSADPAFLVDGIPVPSAPDGDPEADATAEAEKAAAAEAKAAEASAAAEAERERVSQLTGDELAEWFKGKKLADIEAVGFSDEQALELHSLEEAKGPRKREPVLAFLDSVVQADGTPAGE